MKKLDAFIIFWAATFAILFFIIGIFFKILASAFYAILNSIVSILKISGVALLSIVTLFLLYGIVEETVNSSLGRALALFGILVIEVVVGTVFILGISSFVLTFILMFLECIVGIIIFILKSISQILDWISDACEKIYKKLLTIIVSRLDKY